MKCLKIFRIFLIACLTTISISECALAQNTTTEDKTDAKKQAFKNMVDSQHFVFVAQSVTPLRGRFRTLTSQYDVTVSKDTLVSYLPYFGRAFSAPINPTESVLDFTLTDFSYTVTPHKKNGWNVDVKPKGNAGVQQLLFTIYDNGSANLNVTSTSRDPISFNGYIKKETIKKKKK